MPIVYNQTVINDRLQIVVDAMDAGAGPALLKVGTAGMAVTLSTMILSDPSASVSGGVLTFLGTPKVDGAAGATGTAAEAEIEDSNGTVVISGLTVGTAGSDIIINTVNISINDEVVFNSGTITGH